MKKVKIYTDKRPCTHESVSHTCCCLADNNKIKSFYRLMINSDVSRQDSSLNSFMLTIRKEINLRTLEKCWVHSQRYNLGLLFELWPYMIDVLKRSKTLVSVTDYKRLTKKPAFQLPGKDISTETLVPDEFFEYTNKDLIIALLEYSNTQLHSRLINCYATTGLAIPVAYQCVKSNLVHTKASLEGLVDVLHSPEGILAISCGTSSATNVGKTDLLSRLLSLPDTVLERNPGGVFHPLSVDMVFGTLDQINTNVVAVDVHGFDINNSGFFAVVSLILSASSLVILHVTADDFKPDGTPSSDIKNIIQVSSNEQLSVNKIAVVLLWRDFDSIKHKEMFEAAKSQPLLLSKLNTAIIPVSNLEKLRNERKILGICESITKAMNNVLNRCGSDRHNPMPNLRTMAETLVMNASKRNLQFGRHIDVTQCHSSADLLRSIQREVHGCLDNALKQSSKTPMFQWLFPYSTLDSAIARLDEEMCTLARRGFDDKAGQEIYNIKQKQSNMKKQYKDKRPSPLVKYFASLVEKQDTLLIEEFNRQINAWKSPKCEEPLKKRNELHLQMEVRLSELRQNDKKTEVDPTLNSIKEEITKINKTLDGFDISIDDVWSDLISMAEKTIDISCTKQQSLLEKHCNLDPNVLQEMYKNVVLEGNPIQLLRGHPLYMASDFLSHVLRKIHADSHQSCKKLFVVSVIGEQSSAKSTLLNYLFGCGFQTQAGRCTKGLYVSLVHTPQIDVLVLDSEGLMSVEHGSADSDNTITLMAAACSHVVIVNQKGEIVRQLRQLLGVAVFALKHLQVLDLKPYVWFVLRDQTDLKLETLRSQFIKMNKTLLEESTRLNVAVSKFVNLSPESVHLLPPAYSVEKHGDRIVKQPSDLFSERIIELRSKLFQLYEEECHDTSSKGSAFSSMPDWLVHVRTVWEAVQKYGGSLTHYESLHQVEQRKEVSEAYRNILETKIEGPSGFDASCDKLLAKKMSLSTIELVQKSASEDLKDELNNSADKMSDQATDALNEHLRSGTYPSALITEFTSKLRRRVEDSTKHIWSAWKQYVARKQSKIHLDNVQRTLAQKMDSRILTRQEPMERTELEKLFDDSWKEYIRETEQSLHESMLTKYDIETSVTRWIDHKVTAHPGEHIYATLKSLATKTSEHKDKIFELPAESFRKYVKVKNAGNPVTSHWTLWRNPELPTKIQSQRMEQVCTTVNHYFKELDRHYLSSLRWKPDNAYCAQQVAEAVSMVATIEQKLQSCQEKHIQVKLEVKEFANDVLDCLQKWIIDHWIQKQKEDKNKEIDHLKANKSSFRDNIFNRRDRQEGDQSRAIELAHNVREKLTDWVEKTILQSSVRLKRELQRNLENAQAAAQHAYEESFGKENWSDVVDYCENASKYLQRVFEKRFDWIANDLKQRDLAIVKDQVGLWVRKLKDVTMLWKLPEHQKQPTDNITTKQFVKFAAPLFHSRRSVANTLFSHEMFETFMPDNVEISDPHHFKTFFLDNLDSPSTLETALYELAEQSMDEQLNTAKFDVWEIAKGCPEVCPCCKTKCSLEKDHLTSNKKHKCDIHVLSALGGTGTMESIEGICVPTFKRCTSKEFVNNPKQKRADPKTKRPNVATFYKEFFPNWSVPDSVSPAETSVQEIQQRRAWVNCRARLLKLYPYMTDTTPEEWIQRYENNPLT